MSPAAIIALVRDAVIVGAVLSILWFVHRADTDHVKVTDFQAVQTQLQENARDAARNALRAQQADTQRAQDLAQVSAAVAAQHAPILLRGPPGGSPVSCPTTRPGSQPAGTRGAVQPPRADPQPVDIREPINAYEIRLETIVADCRAAIEKWPR